MARSMMESLPLDSGRSYDGPGLLTRKGLAVGHALVLATAFSPPFVLCVGLGMSADVSYWSGRRALAPILLVPLLFLLPFAHMYWKTGTLKTSFFMMTIVVPTIVFAAVGGLIRERTENAANALYNRDCHAFGEKRSLQRAYEVAQDFRAECQKQQDFDYIPDVRECEGYGTIESKYSRELSYLQALEWRFPCAGICRGSARLFEAGGKAEPGCALFLAQWLRGASSEALIVLWYSVLAGLVAIPSYTAFVRPLVRRGFCEP